MDYTTGCITAHVWAQNIFLLPVFYKDSRTQLPKLCQREDWKNKGKKEGRRSIAKLYWFASKYYATASGICCLFRLLWQLKYWSQVKDFEMVGYDAFSVTMSMIAYFAYDAVDQNIPQICYYVTQRFVSLSFSARAPGDRFPQKVYSRDIFLSCFSSGFYAGGFVYVVTPFIRNYDTNQVILTQILKLANFDLHNEAFYAKVVLLLVKLISSNIYLIFLSHAATVTMIVIVTLNVMILESYIELTHMLLNLSKSSRGSLYGSAHRLSILRIFITTGHYIVNIRFVPVITGVGTLMASLCGLVALSMYSRFPLVMYLFCATLFFGSIVVTVLLGTLASIPHENVETIKNNWQRRALRRQDKMVLRSWPVVGFAIGPVRPVNRGTSFTVLDNISNFTTSLILF